MSYNLTDALVVTEEQEALGKTARELAEILGLPDDVARRVSFEILVQEKLSGQPVLGGTAVQ